MGIIELVANERTVWRPGKTINEKTTESACVTSKKAHKLTLKAVEELIAQIRGDGANRVVIFNKLRVIFGITDGTAVKNLVKNIGEQCWNEIFDYLNHAMHTEVQLIAAKSILKDDLVANSVITSTKLPCWSCIRLPLFKTMEHNFNALRTGLFDGEILNYPEQIFIERKAVQPESFGTDGDIVAEPGPGLCLLDDGVESRLQIYVVKWDRVNALAFRRTLQYNSNV
jgi:hypothetical protein